MNEREQFWAGEFGDEYNRRSPGDERANYEFFQTALSLGGERVGVRPQSILELGCGVGRNLEALRRLLPSAALAGVEINSAAFNAAVETHAVNELYEDSLLTWIPPRQWDLAFTKGVLIHIDPRDLPLAYGALVRSSSRYILIAEYYSPRFEMIPYRGEVNKLWKGPHAEEMLKRYPDLKLIDYGFVSKLDQFPQDDLNWWLIEKRGEHGNESA